MKYAIANWKQNMNSQLILDWFSDFEKEVNLEFKSNVEVIILPTFLHIPLVVSYAKNLGLDIGAQATSEYDKGAHTGKVGSDQLAEFCKYVLVGHSECKNSVDQVNKKIELNTNYNLKSLICFVEVSTLKSYGSIPDDAVIIMEDPANISKDGNFNALSSNGIAQKLEEARAYIKQQPILYGGSVNTNNVQNIMLSGVDGFISGSESLSGKKFAQMVNSLI